MGERTYLDHAATTPMLPAVRDAWVEQSGRLGNPSSLHASGRRARRAVEESRESIAGYLGVRPSAVVFTSGGTEADNLAVKGLYWSRRAAVGADRVLASSIEHHAVLDPVVWLQEQQGADVTWLGVDALGRVDLSEIEAAVTEPDRVAVCTVMWANNEIGTVQPVHAIASLCRSAGVPFHTDAVQVLGYLPLDLGALEADAVTLSSHKIGGPFGVGALIVDPRVQLTPVLHGGGQEREVRSGTLDAAAIVGFAVAVEHAVQGQPARLLRLAALREELIAGIRAAVPDAILNGDPGVGADQRLPGNVHFSFPGCEGDLLLMLLDAAGIDCSTGSACTAGIPEPSHVLLAMGVNESLSRSSLRFSLGEATTPAEIAAVVAALPGAVERARRAGSLAPRAG
ncbi:MAG: cysteine desulfurase family protein [Actinobacteria bacterium]|nr:cysteine desulfurase family protein [Actinomycetota bacterium]